MHAPKEAWYTLPAISPCGAQAPYEYHRVDTCRAKTQYIFYPTRRTCTQARSIPDFASTTAGSRVAATHSCLLPGTVHPFQCAWSIVREFCSATAYLTIFFVGRNIHFPFGSCMVRRRAIATQGGRADLCVKRIIIFSSIIDRYLEPSLCSV